MKTVYIFDPDNFRFLHAYDCQPDPMEPGKFIEPVYSTPKEPLPAIEGQVVCFNLQADEWEYKPDNSGTWYKPDGEIVELPAFDSVVGEGWTREPPPPSLNKLRADKATEIDLACRNAIYAGFTSNALGAVYHYPAKDKDQANLVGSVTESLYPNLDPEWVTPFWCATDNANGVWAYRAHTAAQIQQVGTDAKAAIVAALTYNAQLQAQIAVADAEGLAAIVWNPPA